MLNAMYINHYESKPRNWAAQDFDPFYFRDKYPNSMQLIRYLKEKNMENFEEFRIRHFAPMPARRNKK